MSTKILIQVRFFFFFKPLGVSNNLLMVTELLSIRMNTNSNQLHFVMN